MYSSIIDANRVPFAQGYVGSSLLECSAVKPRVKKRQRRRVARRNESGEIRVHGMTIMRVRHWVGCWNSP